MQIQLPGLCFTDAEGLAFHHDPRLVALSYLVAVAGSYAALEMIERWRNARSARAPLWQLASAAALGGSIWSMHFVAMLALRIELPLTYAPGLTLLSLLIAIGVVWCGLQIVRSGASPGRICGAGAIVGVGVAAMHYIGMASVRFPGELAYSPGLWSLSLLIAITAATVALWLAISLQKPWHRATAALVMGAAICGMHYTGMAATVFRVDPLARIAPGLSTGPLAAAVGLTALALILCALVVVATDRRLLAGAMREAEILRSSNERLAQANFELALGHRQLDAVLDNMTQGVCFYDGEQRLLVWNRRYTEIYGLPPGAVRAGMSLQEIARQRHGAGSAPEMAPDDYYRWLSQIVVAKAMSKTQVTLRNGRVVSVYHHPMPDGGWVATHEDITERQQAEAKIAFMARHDALTQLPNRVLFQERLEQAVEMAARGSACAVLCLDLDHFKLVNDTLGHPIGDALLRAAADRVRACLREVDTLARLGGDEFAIIQVDMRRADDASLLADRIIAALGSPFDIDGHQIVIGTSIGVAVAPGDGPSSGKLLKNADIALYLAKSEGRGTARFFEPEMDARIQLRRTLELDLRGAISRNEFEVYYQPQVNLLAGRIVEFEALLRWHHPIRGLIPPSEFIPIAEETGMIVQIGEWVLRTACFEAESWPDDIKVAVNLSPIQFRKNNLVASVRSALAASGLRADRLELEITESVLMQDTANSLATLHQLRNLGVIVALDDFGTGYSSLSYLRDFPFDKIKIDQSFVRELGRNDSALAIIRAVTGLGGSLSLTTTAEGVETLDQLDRLRKEGCLEVQGFIFSAPKPASEVSFMIESFRKLPEAAD